MAKRKPANSEQHLDEVLPAVPSPSDDFDGDDGSDDTLDFVQPVVVDPREVAVKAQVELAAAKAEIARLKAELAASKPIENASGESAWYFDASQNPTPLAVPVGVAYGKTQTEALSRFLARSGVGTLAKSPVCEIATAEQIKQYEKAK